MKSTNIQEQLKNLKKLSDSLLPNLFNYLGLSLYCVKRYEESIDPFKNTVQLDTSEPVYYNNLGQSYFNMKKYEEAIKPFEKVIQLDFQL